MIKLYRRLERIVWLAIIGWLVKRYWPQIEQMLQQVSGGTGEGGGNIPAKAQQVATKATEAGRAAVHDVREQVGHMGEPGGVAGNVTHLADRAKQMASGAGEKVQAMTHDVRQQAGLGGSGQADAGEGDSGPAGRQDVGRFASEYVQGGDAGATQSDAVATQTGIPTASREASLASNQHAGVGGIDIDRDAAEQAAGGTLTERPGESGVSRRSDEQREAAYAFAGDMGVAIDGGMLDQEPSGVEDTSGPIADRPREEGISRGAGAVEAAAPTSLEEPGVPTPESPLETTGASSADDESGDAGTASEETRVADSIQSSVSDSDIDTASYEDTPEVTNIARDASETTWQRSSDELSDPTGVLSNDDLDLSVDASGEAVDLGEGPWEAESASDFDFPAASRGARVWGEESEEAGLSAESGEGFGRDEEDLLTTGGEIDLENDEAPGIEAADTQDVVSLDQIQETEDQGRFGGEDSFLAGDTLGLRDSETEPVRAGRDDDVSMRLETGGPEEEERDASGNKPEDDVSGDGNPDGSGDAPTTGDSDDSTSGISGDYGEAAETQTVPAVPVDEEAGTPPDSGDVRDRGSSASASSTSVAAGGNRRGERQRRVPKGAVLAEGSGSCPADFPIKGNANSRIYHMPDESSYEATIPEFCFATEDDARAAGFRPRKR